MGGALVGLREEGRDWQVHFEAAGGAFFEMCTGSCSNLARFSDCRHRGEKENGLHQPSSVASCLFLNETPFKLAETKARSWMISILWSCT